MHPCSAPAQSASLSLKDSMRGYALVNKDNRNKVFSRIAEFKRLLLGHNVTQVEYAMMLNLIDNHFTAK